jgi:hypothetical protein
MKRVMWMIPLVALVAICLVLPVDMLNVALSYDLPYETLRTYRLWIIVASMVLLLFTMHSFVWKIPKAAFGLATIGLTALLSSITGNCIAAIAFPKPGETESANLPGLVRLTLSVFVFTFVAGAMSYAIAWIVLGRKKLLVIG